LLFFMSSFIISILWNHSILVLIVYSVIISILISKIIPSSSRNNRGWLI
jgi:uncharacterized protein YggT (Ycf19 family)